MSRGGIKIPGPAAQHGWQIRRAEECDAAAISRFHEAQRRPVRADSVATEYFLAVGFGDIFGCAAVRVCGQQGYLYGLAVNKAWRRRGIGHALTQSRLDFLREAGTRTAYVFAMFWNIRFFKRHGFTLADRKKIPELVNLHRDFAEGWNSRSALLQADCLTIRSYRPTLNS